MKISPLDIRKQEFGKQVRGFDVEEVRSFLDLVAEEFELALNQAKELAKEVEELKAKASSVEEVKPTLPDSTKDVQEIKTQKVEKASEESEFTIQKAQLEADKIIHNARKKHQRLLDDIHRLEGQRRGYLIKMHHILKSQLELIDVIEGESPEKELTPGAKTMQPRPVVTTRVITKDGVPRTVKVVKKKVVKQAVPKPSTD